MPEHPVFYCFPWSRMPEPVWNQGLTVQHADGRVRSGMTSIQVIHLPKGTTLYRFQTAGAGLGGWWSTREVVDALIMLSHVSGLDLGTHARLGSAVLHSWNELNELITGEVVRPCMAFTGRGRPQSELIPHTNFKVTYSSCRDIPQVYVPSEDLVGRSGRRAQCMAVRRRERIKSGKFHGEHHRTPIPTDEARRQDQQETRQSLRNLDTAIQRLKQGKQP